MFIMDKLPLNILFDKKISQLHTITFNHDWGACENRKQYLQTAINQFEEKYLQ